MHDKVTASTKEECAVINSHINKVKGAKAVIKKKTRTIGLYLPNSGLWLYLETAF